MIKECKVLSYNPFLNIIVVEFGDKIIQMTGKIDKGVKTIFVNYEDGIATISSKEDCEKSLDVKAINKPKKVKTICAVVDSGVVENETDEASE